MPLAAKFPRHFCQVLTMRSARCRGICCRTCSSVFWKQRHVALYSDKGALVLVTFNTCFGYLGRFRLNYNSPRSWSSRKDKSITRLQSATKFLRHCTPVRVTSENKRIHTPLPPPLYSKVVCLLFSMGSSNSGTTFRGGDGGGKDLFSPCEVSKTSEIPYRAKCLN